MTTPRRPRAKTFKGSCLVDIRVGEPSASDLEVPIGVDPIELQGFRFAWLRLPALRALHKRLGEIIEYLEAKERRR